MSEIIVCASVTQRIFAGRLKQFNSLNIGPIQFTTFRI